MSALNLQASEDGVVLKLIPDDVMYSIMLKLPNKSLVRFLLLSKQWKSVITSKQFSQQRKMISSKSSDGIILSTCNSNRKKGVRFNAHLISGSHDRQALPAVELWHPCHHQARENCQVWHFLFLGDGLVGDCFYRNSKIDCEYSLVIWNPLTGQHKKVPPPGGEDQTKPPTFAGLGYDATIDDYKIVLVFDARVVVRALDCDDEWRIVHFVLSDEAWFQWEGVAVAVDGDILWIARRSLDKSFFFMKFCLAEEKLFTVTWPPKSRPNIYIHHLKRFCHEDSLHLIGFGLSKVFNIWRMVKKGDAISWELVYRDPTSELTEYPIGFMGNGALVYRLNRVLADILREREGCLVRFREGWSIFCEVDYTCKIFILDKETLISP